MWIGIALAYAAPALPASFTIMALAATEYALAALTSNRQTNPRPHPDRDHPRPARHHC